MPVTDEQEYDACIPLFCYSRRSNDGQNRPQNTGVRFMQETLAFYGENGDFYFPFS